MNLDALDVRSEPPAALHHGVPHLARGEYLAIKWKTRRFQGSCLPKTPIFPHFRQNIPRPGWSRTARSRWAPRRPPPATGSRGCPPPA